MRNRSSHSHASSRYQFQKPKKALPAKMHTESKVPKPVRRPKMHSNKIIMSELNIHFEAKATSKAIPSETPSRRSIIKKRHRLPRTTPVLTPLQKLTCFLAATQCLMMMMEVSAGPTSRRRDESGSVREICTSKTILSPNKPSIQLGYTGKQIIPTSCFSDLFSPQCKQDVALFHSAMQSGSIFLLHPAIEAERNKLLSQSSAGTFAIEASKIGRQSKLTKEQQAKFNKHVDQISKLINIKAMHDYTKRIGMGNCGEHTSYSLYKLLQLPGSYQKLQRVDVSRGQDNHVFVIVDGKAEDITISNNPTRVRAYLKTMEGNYCDTWNEGFYKPSEEAMMFYNKWHSITVETIAFEFDMEDLPKKAVQFLQKTLNDLDLGHLAKTTLSTPKEKTEEASVDSFRYRPGY